MVIAWGYFWNNIVPIGLTINKFCYNFTVGQLHACELEQLMTKYDFLETELLE